MNDLLKVLDMSEEEQVSWLCNYIYHHEKGADYWHNFLNRHISLADLAFRLRDDLVKQAPYSMRYAWENALEEVYQYEKELNKEGTDKAGWGLDWSQPIHWIIAALIAKNKNKK